MTLSLSMIFALRTTGMLTSEEANNTSGNAMGDRGTPALNRCTKKLKTTTGKICNDKNKNVAEDVRTTLV